MRFSSAECGGGVRGYLPARRFLRGIHNEHVIGRIGPTPGIALVPNEERDYLVLCNRSGFEVVSAVLHARTETRSLWQKLGSTEISAPGGVSVTFALIPRQRLR
jgi:hypothetical protein